MSFISQNIVSKKQVNDVIREETIESLVAQPNEEAGLTYESELVNLKRKIRRKEPVGDSLEVKQLEIEQEKEMKRLENFLFGSLYSPVEFGKEVDEQVREDKNGVAALVFTDKSANGEAVVYEEDVQFRDRSEDEDIDIERKPVWIDDEEERATVDIAKVNKLRKLRREADESLISGADYVSRLRAQHIKLNPGTEWAKISNCLKNYRSSDESDEGEEEEEGVVAARGYEDIGDDMLRTNEDLVMKSSTKLLPRLLDYSKLKDVNSEEPSKGPINSVQFHRNAQLLLTAGLDRRLSFFQIDGKRNTKIQSIFVEDCPIHKASFLPDGSQVIMGGRRKFFYSFDLVKAKVDKIGPLTGREEKSLEFFEVSSDSKTIAFIGNEGYILLVSTKTKELIGTLKMNGTARSLAFADDGRQLLSFGGDGHIYHWDLRTMRCFHKAVDEGCLSGSAICTSPDSTLFAAGSNSGIVNIYNREEFLGGKRKPMKTIENLITKIDGLKFNPDAQILAISSTMQKNSLKLVHIPSFNVFSNWPSPNSTLQYPRCLDFSPGGGFMAVGNAAGKVLLYKLHHYQHA